MIWVLAIGKALGIALLAGGVAGLIFGATGFWFVAWVALASALFGR